MIYAAGRQISDADSHFMQWPDFLSKHADPGMRDRLSAINYFHTLGNSRPWAVWD